MRIYLKKNDYLDNNAVPAGFSKKFVGQIISDFDHFPYVDIIDDSDILQNSEILREVFLKATIVAFPDFTKKSYKNSREFGIYRYGKAKAELTSAQNAPYYLKVETSDWDGVADMKVLQEKLWAGSITPSIFYERKQKRTMKEKSILYLFIFSIIVTIIAGAVAILGFSNLFLSLYNRAGFIPAIDDRAVLISMFVLTLSIIGAMLSYVALPSYKK